MYARMKRRKSQTHTHMHRMPAYTEKETHRNSKPLTTLVQLLHRTSTVMNAIGSPNARHEPEPTNN